MSSQTDFAVEAIEALYDAKLADRYTASDFRLFASFMDGLDSGALRAAEPDSSSPTGWRVNPWIKKGILLGFRMGKLVNMSIDRDRQPFYDKSTYPVKRIVLHDKVRIVPGGTSIRSGCYVAPGVVFMPPSYANVGCYIDFGTMIDSHALVGSCAQIGARCHISAAAQIGGVLEPVGAMPVIIEDDVMVGGNCGLYEGVVVKRRAVLGTGVILNRSTPVYDVVRQKIYRATENMPLVIPEGAVVVAGSRPLSKGQSWGYGLQVYTPLITKYRDANTDARTALEDALR